jgi:sulfite exporter TauE/SafE
MIDGLMIFTGGLLGSSHCIGMCGGFALALGVRRGRWLANAGRQTVYGLGRVFTYTTAGAAVGFCGGRLTSELQTVVNVQAVLSIAAGVLLAAQGLIAAGVWRWGVLRATSGPCLGPAFFGALLTATRLRSVFLGGMVNGLLPCGLVYAYLALAGSSGGLLSGGATMGLFGLGTLPVMVLVGCGGTVVSLTFRRQLFQVAAWCVVLTGVLAVLRGLGFLQMAGPLDDTVCPLCP